MKFSTTDIYLESGVTWAFIEGAELTDVETIPNNMSKQTNVWNGKFDMSVYRVNANDGVYVFAKDEMSYKVKFLTYYNANDEPRFPTMQIASLDNSTFPYSKILI